jgi:hypothetical protein
MLLCRIGASICLTVTWEVHATRHNSSVGIMGMFMQARMLIKPYGVVLSEVAALAFALALPCNRGSSNSEYGSLSAQSGSMTSLARSGVHR